MTSSRRCLALASILAGTGVTACGDYAHANPFDPATPVQLTINGPDTAYALYESLRFTLSADPAYAFETPRWEWAPGQGSLVAFSDVQGVYTLGGYRGSGIDLKTATVRATLRTGRTAVKQVVLVQRPAALFIHDCSGVFVPRVYNLRVGGASARVCSEFRDRNNAIVAETPVPATGIVRESDIARLTPASNEPMLNFMLYGTAPGSTYVVLTARGFSDSVLVTVR